jgi:hypothetical protein
MLRRPRAVAAVSRFAESQRERSLRELHLARGARAVVLEYRGVMPKPDDAPPQTLQMLLDQMNRELRFKEGDEQTETLWHYTDAAGARGILTQRDLWATHYAFLNDREELIHGEKVVQSAVEELADELEGDTRQILRDFLSGWGAFRLSAHTDVFVASFCTDGGDRLSQWRGYGGAGAGYAIGFKSIPALADVTPGPPPPEADGSAMLIKVTTARQSFATSCEVSSSFAPRASGCTAQRTGTKAGVSGHVTETFPAATGFYAARFAVDDNLGTRWAPGRLPGDLVVDLGSDLAIGRCETTFEYVLRAYRYRIEYLTQSEATSLAAAQGSSAWHLCTDRSSNTQTPSPITDVKSATARYLRLTVLGADLPDAQAEIKTIIQTDYADRVSVVEVQGVPKCGAGRVDTMKGVIE